MGNVKKNEDNSKTPEIPGPHPAVYHLTALLLPWVIFTTLVFALFKQLVKIYLIFKHGKKFGGFFHSADSVWWTQEKTYSSIVPLLLVIKSPKQCDMVEKIKKRLKDKIFDTTDYPKLTSTCHFCCGYPYMILDEYDLEQCVKILKNPEINRKFDENYLCEVVSEIGTTGFDKTEALWEIHVTNRHFDSKDNEYSYPFLIKMHHSVGDGVAVVTFLLKLLGDSISEQYVKKVIGKYLENYEEKKTFRSEMTNFLNQVKELFELLYISLGRIFWVMILRDKDKSVLHGPNLSGEKIAVLTWEQNEKLVPLVKKIKNQIPNCTFSDVIYTALSGSLTDFFKETGEPIPSKISSILPIILSYREIAKPGPVKLFNKFTVTQMTLPTKKGSFRDTLERVRKEMWIAKNLPEVKLNFWLLNYIIGVIPTPIFKKTFNANGLTQAFSNLPGAAKTIVLDGCHIANVVAFPPHRWKMGLSIMCLTYDNRFQIGLIVDRSLIPVREEAQKIVDNFLRNIIEIDKEICG